MPGIFGIVSSVPRPTLAADLAEMGRRMRHHPWYREDRYADVAAGVGLGHVGLGSGEPGPQPGANEDGSLRAVLAGEVLEADRHRRGLVAAGHRFAGSGDAELLLHGYEEHGRQCFEGLRGPFALALWDDRAGRLFLVNDRFGMGTLYYARLPGRLLFASELKALLVDADLPRQTSARGLAQFFTYGHLLGEDTLLEAVRVLPAGAWLTYDVRDDTLTVECLRRPVPRVRSGERLEGELLDEIDAALRRAVDVRTEDGSRLGLSLSGGLDARTLLALVGSNKPVTTVTLGMEGSIDVRSAERLAGLAGWQHHTCVLDAAFLVDFEGHLRRMVHLTDGQYLSQCITLPTLPLYRDLGVEVLLRGHGGELMHLDKAYNFSVDARAWALSGGDDLEEWLFGRLRAYMLEGVGEGLFAPPFRGRVDGLARESLRECLRESEGMDHPVNRVAHLFLRQRVRRETALSMMEFGSVTRTRLPYLDPELVDLLFAAPPRLRLGDRIQAHVLRRCRPDFLRVVNANTGTVLGAGRARRAFHTLRMRVLARLGVKGYQPYERLGRWLREELRPLVHRLLLHDRCLGRGVFNPDALRRVLHRHLDQGHNHTYLVLALMIFELGQRQLVDGDGFREAPPVAAGETALRV
jgi:asparagine synthase (glutamine-hydrolysing)